MLAKSEELEAGGRALKGASVKSEASQASGGLGLVKRTDSFHSSPSLSTRTVEGLKAFPTKLSVLLLVKDIGVNPATPESHVEGLSLNGSKVRQV